MQLMMMTIQKETEFSPIVVVRVIGTVTALVAVAVTVTAKAAAIVCAVSATLPKSVVTLWDWTHHESTFDAAVAAVFVGYSQARRH